jgi:hypothetical protein
MIVIMKRFEKLANDYCQKFKKSWDSHCIASDAYISGYNQAISDCESEMERSSDYLSSLGHVGEEPVEVEFKDGDHMIGSKLTDRS